jgi:hypothetical protein
MAQLLEGALAAPFLLGGRTEGRARGGGGLGARRWGRQTHSTDVEVFFEAIQLQQV